MSSPEKAVVEEMFAAFAAQDVARAVSTVSDNTLWIHHGTQKLPSLRFVGKRGVQQFFEINFSTMKVEYFRVQQMLQDGNKVIALGEEKFTLLNSGAELAQKWVQVYTVENGLITHMDEFATSASDEEYRVVA